MMDRLLSRPAMSYSPSTNAVGFLQHLVAERSRLAAYRNSLHETIARDAECLSQVEMRLQAMEALANSYRSELPGDTAPTPPPGAEPSSPQEITVGPLRLHLHRRCAFTLDGSAIELTNTQFRCLEVLALAGGKDVSRDTLSERLFGYKWNGGRNIDQLVFQTKRKLPRCEDGGELIRSVRGSGYWMRDSSLEPFSLPDPATLVEEFLSEPSEENALDDLLSEVIPQAAPEPAETADETPAETEGGEIDASGTPDLTAELPVEQDTRDETASRVEKALQEDKALPKPLASAAFAPPSGARGNVWAFGHRIKKQAAASAKPDNVEAEIQKFIRERGVKVCSPAFAAETRATISEADRMAIAAHTQLQEESRIAALPIRKSLRNPA